MSHVSLFSSWQVTEDFAHNVFSLTDMMLVLTTSPDDSTWQEVSGWQRWKSAQKAGADVVSDVEEDPTAEEELPEGVEEEGRLLQLPLLMRSPFLRLLHGVFFSVSVSGDDDDASAKTVPVFKYHHDKLIRVFSGECTCTPNPPSL